MHQKLSPEAMNEIVELIYSGQKIAACKRYMELHGQELDDMPSLLQAKEFIEQLTDELRAATPDRFSKSNSGGCSAVLLLMMAAVIIPALWWVTAWIV